jgi:hypothetical protein
MRGPLKITIKRTIIELTRNGSPAGQRVKNARDAQRDVKIKAGGEYERVIYESIMEHFILRFNTTTVAEGVAKCRTCKHDALVVEYTPPR